MAPLSLTSTRDVSLERTFALPCGIVSVPASSSGASHNNIPACASWIAVSGGSSSGKLMGIAFVVVLGGKSVLAIDFAKTIKSSQDDGADGKLDIVATINPPTTQDNDDSIISVALTHDDAVLCVATSTLLHYYHTRTILTNSDAAEPFAMTTCTALSSVVLTQDNLAYVVDDNFLYVGKPGTTSLQNTNISASCIAVHPSSTTIFVGYNTTVSAYDANDLSKPIDTIDISAPESNDEPDNEPDAFCDEECKVVVDTIAIISGEYLAVGTAFTDIDSDELVDSPVGVLQYKNKTFVGLHALAHNELGASPGSDEDRPGAGPMLHVATARNIAVLANARSTDNHCALVMVRDDGVEHVTPADDRYVLNVPMAQDEGDNTVVGMHLDVNGGAGIGHGPLEGPPDPRGSDLPPLPSSPLLTVYTSDGHLLFYQMCEAGSDPVQTLSTAHDLQAALAALPEIPQPAESFASTPIAQPSGEDALLQSAMSAGLPDDDDGLLSDDDEQQDTATSPHPVSEGSKQTRGDNLLKLAEESKQKYGEFTPVKHKSSPSDDESTATESVSTPTTPAAPASTSSGWGDAFLSQNKATMSEANDAVAAEVDAAKGGGAAKEPTKPSTISFGATTTPAASSGSSAPAFPFGAAATTTPAAPASTSSGWGDAFLSQNKATMSEANDAVAAEVDAAKGGGAAKEPTKPSAFSFGAAATTTPAAPASTSSGWGDAFLSQNKATMSEANNAVAAEMDAAKGGGAAKEPTKPSAFSFGAAATTTPAAPASTSSGWGDAFLSQNKATMSEANDAVAAEVDAAKGGGAAKEPTKPSAFSFGAAATTTPAAPASTSSGWGDAFLSQNKATMSEANDAVAAEVDAAKGGGAAKESATPPKFPQESAKPSAFSFGAPPAVPATSSSGSSFPIASQQITSSWGISSSSLPARISDPEPAKVPKCFEQHGAFLLGDVTDLMSCRSRVEGMIMRLENSPHLARDEEGTFAVEARMMQCQNALETADSSAAGVRTSIAEVYGKLHDLSATIALIRSALQISQNTQQDGGMVETSPPLLEDSASVTEPWVVETTEATRRRLRTLWDQLETLTRQVFSKSSRSHHAQGTHERLRAAAAAQKLAARARLSQLLDTASHVLSLKGGDMGRNPPQTLGELKELLASCEGSSLADLTTGRLYLTSPKDVGGRRRYGILDDNDEDEEEMSSAAEEQVVGDSAERGGTAGMGNAAMWFSKSRTCRTSLFQSIKDAQDRFVSQQRAAAAAEANKIDAGALATMGQKKVIPGVSKAGTLPGLGAAPRIPTKAAKGEASSGLPLFGQSAGVRTPPQPSASKPVAAASQPPAAAVAPPKPKPSSGGMPPVPKKGAPVPAWAQQKTAEMASATAKPVAAASQPPAAAVAPPKPKPSSGGMPPVPKKGAPVPAWAQQKTAEMASAAAKAKTAEAPAAKPVAAASQPPAAAVVPPKPKPSSGGMPPVPKKGAPVPAWAQQKTAEMASAAAKAKTAEAPAAKPVAAASQPPAAAVAPPKPKPSSGGMPPVPKKMEIPAWAQAKKAEMSAKPQTTSLFGAAAGSSSFGAAPSATTAATTQVAAALPATTAGWGADFLAKNNESSSAAQKAIEEEISKEKGGGATTLTPAPTSSSSPFGAASTTSLFSTQAPAASPFGAQATSAMPSSTPFGALSTATTTAPSTSGVASSPFGTAPSTSPFGAVAASTATASSTGGAPAPATASSPFGAAASAAAPSSSPFGAAAAAAASPFGAQAPATASSPFGTAASAAAPSSSPFGALAAATTASSTGGAQAPATASSPFGAAASAAAPSSSPFGTAAAAVASPFGAQAPVTASTPFGAAASAAAPSSSPFGATAAAAAAASPFGVQAPVTASSPFGAAASAAAPSSSPFGAVAAAAASPFGAQAPATVSSPFGSAAAASTAPPMGGAPAPAVPSSPFGATAATAASPFGAPAAPSASPFGAAVNTAAPPSSPFGAAAATAASPFGAPAAPSASPFGAAVNTAAPPSSPFGAAAAAASPFGAQAPATPSSPFGAAPSTGGASPSLWGAPRR
ncbi:hypothetical protein PPROV_001093100 [Pycnococcus provasolii]|uniref:Uncharacterized protein n=1 Tax=Pycnococcus provasolii TaxID=41880 RepID=A0A830HZK7_9CHLO|nr:hypothetical protein PPROV_001093100 [Pycnococcus provasolii]